MIFFEEKIQFVVKCLCYKYLKRENFYMEHLIMECNFFLLILSLDLKDV